MYRLTLYLVLLAATAAACGGTSTTPTPPVQPITDVYSGTLNQNGADRYSFVTSQSGQVQATLIALTPSDMIIGLALGTFNTLTGACQVVLANDKATLNSIVIGQASSSGNLCVRVYDVGNVTDPTDYQVQVIHF